MVGGGFALVQRLLSHFGTGIRSLTVTGLELTSIEDPEIEGCSSSVAVGSTALSVVMLGAYTSSGILFLLTSLCP